MLGDPGAGGQGEATVTIPSNPSHFYVDYYDDGRIDVTFLDVNNIRYYTGNMTMQE